MAGRKILHFIYSCNCGYAGEQCGFITHLGNPSLNTKVSQKVFTKFVAHAVFEVTVPLPFKFVFYNQ
jgi:hypothetical protein